MPRTRKDCPLCGKKNLCKLSNHLADIHQLSSEERRVYLNEVKSSCADEENHDIKPRAKRARMDNFNDGASTSSCAEEKDHDIMPRAKRARMDNFDDESSTSSDYHNSDIFYSDDEEEKEYSSEEESCNEEESSSDEIENSEEEGSKQESEDHQTSEDDQTSEDGEDYDPWQTLIHEAKLQLVDEFQENVGCLKNEGFSEVEAKRQSFITILPKLTKELEEVYVERLLWMSHMKKDPIHKKIMQTKDNLINIDSLDCDEALYSAVEKRKFLLKRLLEERQHYSDYERDTNE